MLNKINEPDRVKGTNRSASLFVLFAVLMIFMQPIVAALGENPVSISTQKTDYKMGEAVEISLTAAQGASNIITIKGPTVQKVLKVISQNLPSKLVFIPSEQGAYSVKAESTIDGETKNEIVFFTLLDVKSEHVDEINLDVKTGKTVLGLSEKLEFNVEAGGGNEPYEYYWNFNDGFISNEKAGSHLFNSEGDHYVYLKVSDASGKYAERTLDVKVVEENKLLNVNVKDSESKPIVGADVIVLGQAKKTNAEGNAVFESLGGSYEITVSKEGYKQNKQTVEVLENTPMEIMLEIDKSASSDLAVELTSPEDNFESDTTTITFKFNAIGNKGTGECKVYANDGQTGWKAKEGKYSFAEGSGQIISEIPPGTYSWKIKCGALSGEDVFSGERILGVKEGATSLAPVEEKAQEESPTTSVPQEEPAAKEENQITQGQALLSENFDLESRPIDQNYINQVIEGVTKAKANIEAGNDNVEFAYQTLGLDSVFKDNIQSLKDINKQFDYKRISALNRQDQDKEMAPIKSQITIAYSKIPLDVQIVDIDKYDWFSVSKDLEKVYYAYFKSKGTTLNVEQMADLIQRNLFLQKTTNFRYTVYVVQVDYISGRKEYFTILRKNLDFFNYNSDNNFILLEYVPKEVASSISDVTFVNKVEKVSDDILVQLEKPTRGKELEITYFVKKRINTRLGESTKTVLMITDQEKTNLMTGFAVIKQVATGKSFLFGFALVILVGLVYVFLFAPINMGMQMLKLKSIGLSPSKKLVKQIEEIAVLIQAEKVDFAVEIYTKAMATYGSMGEQEKIMFYDLINHVFNEINLLKVKNLTITAFASYKHGDTDGMNAAVQEIERLYHSFDDIYKTKVENILLELEKMLK